MKTWLLLFLAKKCKSAGCPSAGSPVLLGAGVEVVEQAQILRRSGVAYRNGSPSLFLPSPESTGGTSVTA